MSPPASIGGNSVNSQPFSDTRRMSATRDIYLPSRVPMSALNNGYIQENEEPELPKKYETDTIEV